MASIDLHTHVVPPDIIAAMVAAYPARLRGMATLPMQDPDAAITELERVVKDYRFKAVEMGSSIEGEQLTHPKFRPVLRTIEQLGADRVVIGSDNPFDMGYSDPLGELDTVPNLTAQEKEQIRSSTARILLGEA